MKDLTVLVCGGREFCDWGLLSNILDSIHQDYGIVHLIQGKAIGADFLARAWAIYRDVPFTDHPADWKKHGKSAGPKRNQHMLDVHPDIDLVIAFKGGNGTKDMIQRSKKAEIKVLTCW